MKFLLKHRVKLIIGLIIAIALFTAFMWGGAVPKSSKSALTVSVTEMPATPRPKGTSTPPPASPAPSVTSNPQESEKPEASPATSDRPNNNSPLSANEKEALAAKIAAEAAENPQTENTQALDNTKKNNLSEPNEQEQDVSESYSFSNPAPMDTEQSVIEDTKELYCTLSVRCDTILDNISWLKPEKLDLVPQNGVIFPEQEVVFYEGESVFNVLLREMKKNRIHMEFENTPLYQTAYIQGINNLYEYDCGELSGWMYRVNGRFPNYGCSRYELKNGDRIEFLYTCNLGVDVGGYKAENNSYE